MGVEEEERTGIAKRPVYGLPIEKLNGIQRDMTGYNNKIEPYYMPRIDLQEVDGQNVLVIWVPAGVNRPYNVRERVTAKQSPCKWYVRSGSNTIEAKGEVLDELREMANRIPFDERGNEQIDISDISPALVLDYLQTVGSRLANDFESRPFVEILGQMDLLTGPNEHRKVKNVAAMMFCKNPAKFFPTTQVDIVIFPEGCIENPNNMIEVPKIVGPVPDMIKQTLDYIRTNVIKKRIIKPKDKAESITFFNYPYQAIEEAVVNALYHRDYQEREPVEITIGPQKISILSFAGPDRSISMDAIHKAEYLNSRRYRNRRTIQDELRKNGSEPARIETDEGRTYFLIEIPCREGFENANEPLNEPLSEPLSEKEMLILREISNRQPINRKLLAQFTGIPESTITRIISRLSTDPFLLIERHGSKKDGGYILTEKGNAFLIR